LPISVEIHCVEGLFQFLLRLPACLAQDAFELFGGSAPIADRYSNARGKFHPRFFHAAADFLRQVGGQIQVGEGKVDVGAVAVDFVAEGVFLFDEFFDRFAGLVHGALVAEQVSNFDGFGIQAKHVEVDAQQSPAGIRT